MTAKDNITPELKDCPFCNGKQVHIDAHENHQARNDDQATIYSMCCYDCGATFPNRYCKDLLVAAWNRRK